MKRMRLILILSVVIMTAGCNDNGNWIGGWSIVQSPLSKTCYEAYEAGLWDQRVFSLGKEVKCPPSDQLE